MEPLNLRHIAVLSVSALAVVVCLATGAAGQGDKAATQKWPPQFPREGATKLFENDRIIVWEQVGRPKDAFMHRHVRDTIVFGLQGGRVDTLAVDGKKNDGKAERDATARIYPGNGGVGSVQYTKAGLGPHAEVAPDPNSIPRTIFIELKGTEPKDCGRWSTACP
ncbi:MAG TPA: hypothetical protein VEV17_00505 [Bryobacteraceae bacterium]|nr:hypothetical protein [Bryobacteraceae bacterium]